MPDFWHWLREQADRDDPVGDLSADALRDKKWPQRGWLPHAAYAQYLERYGDHVLAALSDAWAEWVSATLVLGEAPSYVYFVQAVESKRVKIGLTANPAKRLACLRTSSPEKLNLLLAVPGSKADEVRLHVSNASTRVSGEWFSWSPQIGLQAESSGRAIAVVPVRVGQDGLCRARVRAKHIERLCWLHRETEAQLLSAEVDPYAILGLETYARELFEQNAEGGL